ncbi:MAG: FprA family A-type flavoprotein [Myxococcales bacterium]|nr:FprA family A-type flavoprotein [Myxococcales bacterium]
MTVSVESLQNQDVRAAEGAVLFDDGNHRWTWLGEDSASSDGVAANQFLIQDGASGCLLDPGSVLDFSRVVANLSRYSEPRQLSYLFFSHQDPDVSSAMPMWAAISNAKMVMSSVWSRFMPHYGEIEASRLHLVPDEGGTLTLGRSRLEIVPAHYLHSVGNITLYDPVARLLFSGDIGAALVPEGEQTLFVEDFDHHVRYMEGFHRRYMTSGRACADWANRVGSLGVDAIVPQHGSIFRGDDVGRFLRWFGGLRCGVDLIGEGG